MYIYPYSLAYAIKYNERDLWRESYQANCDCARAIEQAIVENYDGSRLADGSEKAVLGEFGIDRVNWVLANTIHEKSHDDRFSQSNKDWAAGFDIPQDTTQLQFVVTCHPGLVNLFTNDVRKAWQRMGLFNAAHCTGRYENFEGKVLVLSLDTLRESCWTPRDQLWLAEGGFGCSPDSRGQAVYATCLSDGEKTRWNRADFLGVLDEQFLPDWAMEKLEELCGPQQEQDGPLWMT